jgi:mono/diheme cytochrome c family protein
MKTGVLLSGVFSLALAGCVGSPGDESSLTEAVSDGRYAHWRTVRAERQAALDQYNAEHADEYASFKNAALGTSGIPMIMLRLFPELFPQIWGPPSLNFAPVGLGEDTLEPGRVLPLGLGYAASQPPIPTAAGPVNLNMVQLTCAGCHTGRVVDGTGSVKHLIGAPSTQFTRFRGSVFATVTSPGYTAAAFTAALNAKPPGWVYGVTDPAAIQKEMLERAVFNALAPTIVGSLKAGSIAGAQRFQGTLGTYTYGMTPNAPNPNGSTPGYLDAIGAGITIVIDPAVLSPAQVQAFVPPLPAMIDIMSVWNQADRPAAQWDGSISSKLHRNLAAELGVVGRPDKLNMDNANKTTAYTEHLPSNPYPFDIDTASAARGQSLYKHNCESCHSAGNAAIFPPAAVGTDKNRAIIWTAYSMAGLTAALRAGCTDAVTCNEPDGSPVPDAEIVANTGGYMALPLDGIWARAPYLHNGSVPSMYALLTGDRPVKFQRGNIAYDQARMGFVETPSAFSAEFDTTRSGNSNVGHDSPAFNGDVDWKNEPQKVNDLISYLKTL